MISIVIPLYNNAKTIGECLNRIYANPSLEEVEVLVVDDGSDDNGASLAQQAASLHLESGFALYSRPHAGAAEARNFGLEHAQGDWVWFVDADDLVDERSLQFLLPALSDLPEDADLFKMGTLRRKENKLMEAPDERATRITGREELFRPKDGTLDHTTYLFRRSFLLKEGLSYPTDMAILEDSTFMLRVLERAGKIARNETFCFYTVREHPLSATRGGWKDSRSETYMQDAERFFGLLRDSLTRHADTLREAQAFWSRYAYLYLRVLAVKRVPWPLLSRFQTEILSEGEIVYQPAGLLSKWLSKRSFYRLFAMGCQVLRPIAKTLKSLFRPC